VISKPTELGWITRSAVDGKNQRIRYVRIVPLGFRSKNP
jgi:hypothetical protein